MAEEAERKATAQEVACAEAERWAAEEREAKVSVTAFPLVSPISRDAIAEALCTSGLEEPHPLHTPGSPKDRHSAGGLSSAQHQCVHAHAAL